MPFPFAQVAMAGLGAAGGIFGGGKSKAQKDYDRSVQFWLQRKRDQELQASQSYQGYVDPATGEYVPGTRQAALDVYGNILEQPGFTEEETSQMGFTPEEEESFRFSPEEAATIQVTPEEEAATIRLSGLPIAGAANRAQQSLLRGTSAAGYGPGLTAALQRIQQEQGRQAAEAALQAKLGILEQRRAGTERVGGQRIRAAGTVAGRRIQIPELTGRERMRQLEVGAGGIERGAHRDLTAQLAYGTGVPLQPLPATPGVIERGVGGAQAGLDLFGGLGEGGGGSVLSPGKILLPGRDYKLGGGGRVFRP